MKHLSNVILATIMASGGLWVPASAGPGRDAQNPEVQFQRAVQLETVEGNLSAAIDLYKQVIRSNGNNRTVAAKALLRLGGCYEKQGDVEASKAYEQLLRDYADQTESATEARTRLAALRKPAGIDSGPVTRRVWAEPKTDFFGRVSPDGKYLSFVDWETGDLAIRDLEKGTNRRLTNKGSWESNPNEEAELSIWSPDSRQVAYQWSSLKGYELRVITLDNPTPRMVYRCESLREWIEPFDWSPDGKHILAVLHSDDANQQMVLVSVADGTVRVLKRLSQSMGVAGAAISPDGRYVLYDYPQSESSLAHDIFLLSIAGGSETPLIEYPADDLALGWTPDGRWALFASDRRGSLDAWAIQTENGKPKGTPVMVKPAFGRSRSLGLTRSGSLCFGAGGARNDVYVVKLDPATGNVLLPPTKLIKRFEGSNRSPVYSPDGKHLAYVSSRTTGLFSAGTGWGDTLCIRSLETGEEREYQREMARIAARGFSRPRWSPDGRSMLLFGRDREGRYGIYHFVLATGEAARVMSSEAGRPLGTVEGWRDEKNFFYGRRDENNNRVEIRLRNLDTGSEKIVHQVSLTEIANGAFSVSRDGRWLSTIDRLKSGEKILSVISTDSGVVSRQFKFSQEDQPDFLRHAWSADDKYVFYTRRVQTRESYKFEVWRVGADGGEPQKTGLEMPGAIDHISAHPDGEHIAFENMAPMSASPAEVWVMENFLPLLKSSPK